MPAANTTNSYGSIAKTFHWLTALLILTAIPLGIVAHQWPYDTGAALAVKAQLFSIHKTVGIAAFFVALARIVWAISQPKPAPMHPDRRGETWLAETMHWTLYGALVLVPLSGWLHHAATEGFAPILWPFGQSLPLVPKDEAVASLFGAAHWVFTKVLIGALILHVAGALKHALIDRDAVLARMWPGRTAQAPAAPQASHRPAILAALVLYLAAGTGAVAISESQAAVAPQPLRASAAGSEWQVREGTLALTVRQMGSAVEGRFASWTADIAFAEEATNGQHGTVTVEIAIGSLTLGSVTDQALGADFFAADTHPTAIFTADILPAETGYVADGTLSLRGASVPVTLPFTLEIEGDTARMAGTTTLDRRTYGIGQSYPDESTVGFPVEVSVALTATRAAD